MKGHIISSFFLMGIFAACTTTVKQTAEPVDYAAMVNPFIGTDFTGNTFPDIIIRTVRLPASVIHIFLELAQAIYMIFLLCL